MLSTKQGCYKFRSKIKGINSIKYKIGSKIDTECKIAVIANLEELHKADF